MKKLLKNKKVLILIGILILIAALAVVYIMLPEDSPIKEAIKQETKQEEVTIVDIDSTTRPIAVMINNHDTVRPYHSGLQDAYILYEIVVEGGISRYMALFKDVEVERIHGIRSARHYYLDYALENDAYFIHWGGSPQAFSDINTLDVDSYEVYDNKYAYYDHSLNISMEHTTYSSTELLLKAIDTKNYREETNNDLLLNYSASSVKLSEEDNAIVANQIDIAYSSSNISSLTYDETTKTYLHSVDNKAHTDYITKEQYTFKNIITYQIENNTIAGESTRQEIHNIGSGTGYYISEGYAIPIKWHKDSRSGQTVYTYENGENIIVNDGNTYIAIQPASQKLTIE